MDIRSSAPVLVFAPHHDDEAIGCGGTLKKLSKLGCPLTLAVATSGETGVRGVTDQESRQIREQETKVAAQILGIQQVLFMGGKDQALLFNGEARDAFIRIIRETKPEHIFFPHGGEMDRDHQIVSQLAREAIWMAGDSTILKEVAPHSGVKGRWLYEVWTPLERPNKAVGIDDVWQAKKAAIEAYRSQLVDTDYVRMAQGLNSFRAVQLFTQHRLVEAFTVDQ